jgi:hypothetical protein
MLTGEDGLENLEQLEWHFSITICIIDAIHLAVGCKDLNRYQRWLRLGVTMNTVKYQYTQRFVLHIVEW